MKRLIGGEHDAQPIGGVLPVFAEIRVVADCPRKNLLLAPAELVVIRPVGGGEDFVSM